MLYEILVHYYLMFGAYEELEYSVKAIGYCSSRAIAELYSRATNVKSVSVIDAFTGEVILEYDDCGRCTYRG